MNKNMMMFTRTNPMGNGYERLCVTLNWEGKYAGARLENFNSPAPTMSVVVVDGDDTPTQTCDWVTVSNGKFDEEAIRDLQVMHELAAFLVEVYMYNTHPLVLVQRKIKSWVEGKDWEFKLHEERA